MKKFSNILLASDVDGTFYYYKTGVNQRNYELINYFKENGGKFILSTGRNTKDVYFIIDDVENVVNAPCVLCNGSLLFDLTTKIVENPFYLDAKNIIDLLGFVRNNYKNIGWRASYDDGFYCCDDDEIILNDLKYSDLLKIANVRPYSELTGQGYYKCVFRSDADTLLNLFPILKEKYPCFDYTRSVSTLLELSPKGISKATQLSFLKDKYSTNDKKLTIACIGDYDNDIDMLKYADISFCPENANENIKQICDKTVCHCKDGAVADAIEYLDKIY